jgi:hypothetical protein
MIKDNPLASAQDDVEDQTPAASISETKAPKTVTQNTFTFTPAALASLGAALLAACGDSGNKAGNGTAVGADGVTIGSGQTSTSAIGATGADVASQADSVSGYRPAGAITVEDNSSAFCCRAN